MGLWGGCAYVEWGGGGLGWTCMCGLLLVARGRGGRLASSEQHRKAYPCWLLSTTAAPPTHPPIHTPRHPPTHTHIPWPSPPLPCRPGMLVNLTGDQRTLSAAEPHVRDFVSALPGTSEEAEGASCWANGLLLPRVNEALTVPTQASGDWGRRSIRTRAACPEPHAPCAPPTLGTRPSPSVPSRHCRPPPPWPPPTLRPCPNTTTRTP